MIRTDPAASPATAARPSLRAALIRGASLFGIWIVLTGSAKPGDLVVGALAAALATWVSLRLLLPRTGRVRLESLPGLALRFLWQSVIAGVDVARRAFHPRLPLRPGFVLYRTRYPRGPARNAFASLTSLLPGTVPCRDNEQGLLYHCLDVEQPVAEQLAAEEEAVSRALPRTTEQ